MKLGLAYQGSRFIKRCDAQVQSLCIHQSDERSTSCSHIAIAEVTICPIGDCKSEKDQTKSCSQSPADRVWLIQIVSKPNCSGEQKRLSV